MCQVVLSDYLDKLIIACRRWLDYDDYVTEQNVFARLIVESTCWPKEDQLGRSALESI